MKKLILFLCLLISSLLSAQTGAVVITSAPTLETIESTKLKKSIANLKESIAQTETMRKSLKLLKDSKELIDKVNSKVTASTQVYRTLKRGADLLVNMSKSKKRIESMRYLGQDDLQIFFNKHLEYVAKTNELLALVKDLLTSDLFKMNDSERLRYIDDISKELDAVTASARHTENRLRTLNNNRKLLAKLK
ncbi:hypothetical protein [Tenacibaculum agarivorans]|uniref:hypothetical protein n=1 Tax=Tenacibaculum agarivorans TaxID=1908389 RepID=UPI00118103E2|nr:hypothetical protein [Tenacibaculum agarivorans]